jgi:membrane protease YdiL (CAAX protease family)
MDEANHYLQLARLGENQWWRYLLSVLFILGSWFGFSVLLVILLVAWATLTKNTATLNAFGQQLGDFPPRVATIISLLSILPLTLSLLAATKWIHRRSIHSLITPHPAISWRRVAQGFGAFLVLVALVAIVEAALYPGRYQFTFRPREFFFLLPFFLILVPIQTTTEELMRGYMLQGFGLLSRGVLLPVIASSLIFMLLHLANPEVGVDLWLVLPTYFIVGLLLAVVTVKDNRLELAIGAHAANNLFVLVANNAVTALPFPAIFTINQLDAVYNLVAILLVSLIFYAVFFLLPKQSLLR